VAAAARVRFVDGQEDALGRPELFMPRAFISALSCRRRSPWSLFAVPSSPVPSTLLAEGGETSWRAGSRRCWRRFSGTVCHVGLSAPGGNRPRAAPDSAGDAAAGPGGAGF
jgi:hypothetical protein